MTQTYILPEPPTANHLFANVPGKGRVRTERYRTWLQAAQWSIVLDGNRARLIQTLHGDVAVEIILGPGRGDIDNRIKPILDLLTKTNVIEDDRRVTDIRVMRGGKPKEAVVTVRSLSEASTGRGLAA